MEEKKISLKDVTILIDLDADDDNKKQKVDIDRSLDVSEEKKISILESAIILIFIFFVPPR